MKKFLSIFILTATLFLSSCEEQLLGPESPNIPLSKKYQSRLATILDSLRYDMKLPALAGAILTADGKINAEAVGCRRYGGEMNVTSADQFHLGSCGKSFTAALMGTLVDEELVSWNTTLQEIFPEYVALMRAEYKSVTVREILSHSAGLMRDPSLTLNSSTLTERRREVLAWAFQQAPVQQKDRYLYSNLGYIIAGTIIEKLSNRTYEDLMKERILIPLGLTTANFGTMGTEGKEDQPLQHTPNHAPIIATQDAGLDPVYNPAGGLYMSVGDWGKYCRWILSIESGQHQTILKDETAKELTKPVVDAGGGSYYAFGWGVVPNDGENGKTLQHSGSNGFNYSTVWLSSTKHYGILVMSNQGAIGNEWPLEKAFYRLLEFYQKGN